MVVLNRRIRLRGFDSLHVHLHPGSDVATDDDAKHDPKSGWFAPGPGAKPRHPKEHDAQADWHYEQAKAHVKAGATKAASEHREAASHHANMASGARSLRTMTRRAAREMRTPR